MVWLLIGGAIFCFLFGLVYPFRAFKVMRDSTDMMGFQKKFFGVIGILFVIAFWWVCALVLFAFGAQYLPTS